MKVPGQVPLVTRACGLKYFTVCTRARSGFVSLSISIVNIEFLFIKGFSGSIGEFKG